jgi:hypothetical protein
MATLFTLPQTTMTPGEHDFGPFNVAGSVNQYVITLTQVGWPGAGDTAFSYSCDVSLDNGTTWISEAANTVLDNPIPAKFGNPANTMKIVCNIRGSGARRVRMLTNWAKSLTISGTIAAN